VNDVKNACGGHRIYTWITPYATFEEAEAARVKVAGYDTTISVIIVEEKEEK
jgi:hypothetical protein